MTDLPVREMVLYKHGVGFFVRQGELEGNALTLTFREDEINDILKSLAVIDRGDGHVLGIHYQTPMDQEHRQANTSINLENDYNLRHLIRDLRGRQVELHVENSAGAIETMGGRVIGVDDMWIYNLRLVRQAGRNPVPEQIAPVVVLLADTGRVEIYPLDSLRHVDISDEQSHHDLRYFLDTITHEDTRRSVQVRLSEGQHDLTVAYVAPSPTWRVSYRVMAEADETGDTGNALIQGWGLFDNRLEEDLDNVRVTLVAGQPISFEYNLYESTIPSRPFVEDETRIAPGPIEFGSRLAAAEVDKDRIELDAEPRFDKFYRTGSAGATKRGNIIPMQMERSSTAASAPAQANAKDAGEFFQYEVNTPVSVKRGESALVPIISSNVKYQRELLYNKDKLPKHPVASLRFDNTTGLTLERGPVTVVENSDYKGEAIVPFTRPDNEVYLPYAVELGIRVTERDQQERRIYAIDVKDQLFWYQEYNIEATTYTIENTTGEDKLVTIEAPIRTRFALHQTREPDIVTAEHRRWRVSVSAHSTTEFVRVEREAVRHRQRISQLTHAQFSEYLEANLIEEAVYNDLAEMLETIESIKTMKKRIDVIDEKIKGIYTEQEQLRQNMGALATEGDEGEFRTRIVQQLRQSQDRLESLQHERGELERDIVAAEKRRDQIIDELSTEKTN